jgi:anti-sigma regulatory factor (Ser/Thr protein kinase)
MAGQEQRARLAVVGTSPAEARKLVQSVLPDAGHDVRADVELAVGELVTNAVVHATVHHDALIEVVIRRTPDRLRVEVHDGNITFPSLHAVDDAVTGGRGLRIVEATTDRWGVEAAPSGKFVWFEVDLGRADEP